MIVQAWAPQGCTLAKTAPCILKCMVAINVPQMKSSVHSRNLQPLIAAPSMISPRWSSGFCSATRRNSLSPVRNVLDHGVQSMHFEGPWSVKDVIHFMHAYLQTKDLHRTSSSRNHYVLAFQALERPEFRNTVKRLPTTNVVPHHDLVKA